MPLVNVKETILHCEEGNSDKVYIVCVDFMEESDMYVVSACWGRRTAPRMSFQSRLSTKVQHEAIREHDSLVSAKLRKTGGYHEVAKQSIRIPAYETDRANVLPVATGSKASSIKAEVTMGGGFRQIDL